MIKMVLIEDIRTHVSVELERFNQRLLSVFSAEEQLLHSVLEYVNQTKGKQIRPLFTLLCAKICGNVNGMVYDVAAAYELLHTASLMHDDVVDETRQRRGRLSANAAFDNKTAILTGDYLLSKSIGFISATKNTELYACLANLGETLARGELLQLQTSYAIPSQEEYIDIIRKKTAVLFTVSAESAAICVNANTQKTKAVVNFADALGICFQIKDDIFDYTPNADIGKPVFNDIREGKITLPLLYALSQLSDREQNAFMTAVKNGDFTDEFFDRTMQLVRQKKGIEYAEKVIAKYRAVAQEALSCFSDSAEKQSLIDLLDYAIGRDR